MNDTPCPDCRTGKLLKSGTYDEMKQPDYKCDNCDSSFNYRFTQGWIAAHEKFCKDFETVSIDGNIYLKPNFKNAIIMEVTI